MSFKEDKPGQENSRSNISQQIGKFFAGGNITVGRITQFAINIAFPFQSQHSRFAQFVALLGYITLILIGFYKLKDQGYADLDTQCLLIVGTVLLTLTCSYYAWFWVPRGAKRVTAKKRQQVRRLSMLGVVIIPLLIYAGFNKMSYIASGTPIIVVTKFKGEEGNGYYKDQYKVREAIRDEVEESTDIEEKARVLTLPNPTEGSRVAEKEGKQKNAAIIIWGWYRTTPSIKITSHFQILEKLLLEKLPHIPVLKDSQTRAKKVKDQLSKCDLVRDLVHNKCALVHTLALASELDPVLENLASEMSYLSLFTLGLIHYTYSRWDRAITRFTAALEKIEEVKGQRSGLAPSQINYLIENSRQLANTNSDKSANEKAIEGYTRAEQLIPIDLLTSDGMKSDHSQHHDLILASYTPIPQLKSNFTEVYNDQERNYISQNNNSLDNNSLVTDANNSVFVKAYRAKNFNNRGVAYARKGDNNQAIANYTQAIQLDLNLAEAYSNQGAAYAEAGKLELAINSINQAIRLNSANPLAHNNLGNAYAYQGKYQEAINAYNLAIKLKPYFAEAYYNRGRIYLLLKNHQEAIESFEKAVELKSNFSEVYFSEVYYYLGVAYYDQKDCVQAIENFDKAIEREPNIISSYEYRGECLLARRDDRAFGDYDKIIKSDPNNSEAYNNRGVASLNKDDYDKAITDFNKAIQLDPNNSVISVNLGTAYLNKKDYIQAITTYDKAIYLNPKNAVAYNNRGNAYLSTKDYEQALTDLNQAIQLDHNNATFYFNRGFLFLSEKDYKRAIKDFDKAIELNENYDYAYFHRGWTYGASGNKSNAIDDFKKVISITSNSELQQLAERSLENLDPDYQKPIEQEPDEQDSQDSETTNPPFMPGNGTSGPGSTNTPPRIPSFGSGSLSKPKVPSRSRSR